MRLSSSKVVKSSPSKHKTNDSSGLSSSLLREKQLENDTLLNGGDSLSIKEDYSSGKESKTLTVENSIEEEVPSETSLVQSKSKDILTEVSQHSQLEETSVNSVSASYKYSTEDFENESEVMSKKKNASVSVADVQGSNASLASKKYSKKVEDDSLTG